MAAIAKLKNDPAQMLNARRRVALLVGLTLSVQGQARQGTGRKRF